MKSEKATKAEIEPEVKILLQLKTDYKKTTGKEWTPNVAAKQPQTQPAAPKQTNVASEAEILQKIAAQGDKVRDLKQKKAEKSAVDSEVKVLLNLKAEYKALTGNDWKPGIVVASAPSVGETQAIASSVESGDVKKQSLVERVNQQGDVVRDLKAKKAGKVKIRSCLV